MSTTIHVNEYLVESITVERNDQAEGDLLVLQVRERCGNFAEDARLVMNGRELWQQVADQLAVHGVVAAVPAEKAVQG